jgi:hypothetical protein
MLSYKSYGFKISGSATNIEVFLPLVKNYLFLKENWYLYNEKIKCSNGLVLKKVINKKDTP